MKVKNEEIHLKGISICRGIAIGKAFFFTVTQNHIPEFSISADDAEVEIARYSRAISQSREDILNLQRHLEKENIIEGAEILDAHLQMTYDPLITSNVENEIRLTLKNAEYVFNNVVTKYQKRFRTLADPYFRERFKDIQDISRRVMGYLQGTVRVNMADIPNGAVIFSKELSASEVAEANPGWVSAFVSATVSSTSHTAVVARGKGIPFVTGVVFDLKEMNDNCHVIVDGRKGEIILNPSEKTLEAYQYLQNQLSYHFNELNEKASLPPETFDGYAIRLSANIDLVNELDLLHKYGGNGVGLFRSEYIFFINQTFPTEDEQFAVYRSLVNKVKGLPIIIRTFDVGGDKFFNDHRDTGSNPFLGCRAIRFLLKEKEIFKAQIRAIIRAGVFGKVSILLPMITSLGELIEAKEVIFEVLKDLKKRGEKLPKKIPIGCMIEVPSAAITVELLAQEVDFLSIGTNDLVQYSLAVDRSNHSLSTLYAPTDPSILRLLKWIITVADYYNIPVTVCGEVAADPRFTPLLMGFGIHELSVAPRYIPLIKNAIRKTSILKAACLAEEALNLSTSKEVEKLLADQYQKMVPNDCLFHC